MSGILQSFAYGRSFTSAPVVVTAPVVSGTAQVRQTLSCSTGTWTGIPTPTYTYQWQYGVSNTNISGATSSTYVVASAYVGQTIRCVVTATNSVGSATSASGSTSAVAANVPTAPTIGTATATAYNTATVTYTASSDNGGATITSYTATASPGGATGSLSTAGSGTITISGLSGSTSYSFTVKANNSVGASAASGASNTITTPAQQFGYIMQTYLSNANIPQPQVASDPATAGPIMLSTTGGVIVLPNCGGTIGADWGASARLNSSNLSLSSSARMRTQGQSMNTRSYAYAGSASSYAVFMGGPATGEGFTLMRLNNAGSGTPSAGFFVNNYQLSGTSAITGTYDFRSISYGSTNNKIVSGLVYSRTIAGTDIDLVAVTQVNASTGAVDWCTTVDSASGSPYATIRFENVYTHAATGNVYGIGLVNYDNLGNIAPVVVKFNSSGVYQWAYYYIGNTTFNNNGFAAVSDSSENLYVVAGTVIFKINSSGTYQWALGVTGGTDGSRINGGSFAVLAPDGFLYVTGYGYSGGTTIPIYKISTSGVAQWVRYWKTSPASYMGSAVRNQIATDMYSNIYVSMSIYTGRNATVLAKVLPDGSGTSATARTISNTTSTGYLYQTGTAVIASQTMTVGASTKHTWKSATATPTFISGLSADTASTQYTPLASVAL